jgi:hypothetical protein
VTVEQSDKTNYIITDQAGNTTKLQFEGDKIRKGQKYGKNERLARWYANFSFWKKFFSRFGFGKDTNSQASAKLQSIQYNDAPVIQLPDNRLHFVWKTSKKELVTLLEQQIEVRGQFKVIGNYNEKKDQTKISIHEKGQPKKETVDGLRLIELKTERGALRYAY